MGVSPENTALAQQLDLLQVQTKPNMSNSQLLWQYNKQKHVLGVPVQQDSSKLPFNTQQQMLAALQLVNDIQYWTGYLSPQYPQDCKAYTEIKQKLADGSSVLVSQDKQFIADKNAFLCFLVYNNLSYRLNERYNFYKQELKND